MKKIFYINLILCFAVLFFAYITRSYGEDKLKIAVLVAGEWGSKEGEFGIEKIGKTEMGYALDFFVTKDSIYILDSINDRIQIFDLNGKFKAVVKLQTKWQDMGVAWYFTLYQNHFYMLVGKPPYYSSLGIREVSKFSYDGEFIKTFGKEQIPEKGEEYYNSIFSNTDSGYIVCSIGGTKILAFDADGNLKDTLIETKGKEVIELMGIDIKGNPVITKSILEKQLYRTLLLDGKNKTIKEEIEGIFSWADNDGDYYFVKTKSLRKKNTLATEIDIYNTKNKVQKNFQISGDIKVIKNNEKVFHYKGNFLEVPRVDAEGNIYHLIALEDGVLLRKITWK